MERIKSILNCLKPTELEAVKELYSKTSIKKSPKRKQLLDLILDDPQLDDREVCLKIYNKSSSSSFSHLKKKVLFDLLKVFYLVNPESQASLPKNINKIYVRRMIQVVNHLITRNARVAYDDIVKECLKLCDKYEYFEEKLLLLQLLFAKSAYIRDRKKFEEIRDMLKETVEKVDRFVESQSLRYELVVEFTNFDPEAYDHEPSYYFNTLKDLKEKTNSFRISENYYMGAISYFEQKRQFDNAIKVAEEFRIFMLEDPTSFSRTHLAGIQMKLGLFNLIAGSMVKALEHTRSSIDLFRGGTYNEWVAMDLLFHIYFMDGNNDKARAVLNECKHHNAFKLNSENEDIFEFYTAALEFQEGNFNEAMFILNKNSNLKKINVNWYIFNRILDMMCQVEAGNYDIFDFKLSAFRKQFYTSFQNKDNRMTAIYTLLKALKKHSFNFSLVKENNQELLQEMQDAKNEYFWDPMEWEIIRFDEWIHRKAKKEHRIVY